MSYCPECRQTFGPWDTVCPTCNVMLVREAAPAPAAPAPAPGAAVPGVAPAGAAAPAAPSMSGAPSRYSGANGPAPASPFSEAPAFSGAPAFAGTTAPAATAPAAGAAAGAYVSTNGHLGASPGYNVPGGAASPQSVTRMTGEQEHRPGRVYHYRVRSGDGQVYEGDLEAISQDAAVAQLRSQGMYVSSIEPRSGSASSAPSESEDSLIQAIYSGASLRARAFFFRQLATLIHSGINVAEAFSLLQSQTSNKLLQTISAEAASRCTAGGKMSDVFRRHPRVFSEVVLEMVVAGEEGGHLDRFLAQIAEYLEREYQISSRIKGALVYPAFVLLALIFLPTVPVWFTEGPGAYFKDTLVWVFGIVFGIAGTVALARLLLTVPSFAMVYDQIKLAIPVVGKVVRQYSMGKFGRTVALLYGAGIPISQALTSAANACGNKYLRSQLLRAVPIVQAGGLLSAAVGQTGCFPPTMMHMISTGEKTGSIDAMVTKIAEFAEADANQAVDQAVVLMLPICVILLGVGVLISAVHFYSGYFSNLLNGQ